MQKEQFSEWGWKWVDKFFFASGGKGALTPLTKILRTLLNTAVTDTGSISLQVCCKSAHDATAEIRLRQTILLPVGSVGEFSVPLYSNKKLSYRRGTSQCVVSAEFLVNCHATVQKLLLRQVLNQVPTVAN